MAALAAVPVSAAPSRSSTVLRAVANASGDLVHGLIAGIVLLSLFVLASVVSLVGVGLLLLPPVLVLAHVNARLTAYRFEAVLGPRIDVPRWSDESRETGWGRRWLLTVGSGRLWRDLAHGLLMMVLGPLWFVLVTLLWAAAITLVLYPLYAGAIPTESWASTAGWPLQSWWMRLVALGAGLLVGAFAAVFSRWTARVDIALARRLLQRGDAEALRTEVRELKASRAAVVEAADAERRRIERDLHDGVQPHLVALAMTLGHALHRFETDPEAARRMVDEAHAESKLAMSELRNVVRGVHPAVLTERGLDAAVSSLAARSPVPVAVDVRLREEGRLPAAIEAAAYFVAAEGLTNVARHSGAAHASLSVVDTGDELAVTVSDDGRGGAAAAPGSGLAGLQDRVAAVGGTLHVDSGTDGTTLTARLPCVS